MRSLRRLFPFGFVFVPLLVLAACGDDGIDLETDYPSAGEDRFELTRATVQLEVTAPGLGALPVAIQQLETVELEGPALVTRSDPGDQDGDGLVEIETEIVSMELTGTASVGPITIRQNPDRRSMGMVEQQQPGQDFPADSFFDMFVEVEVMDVGLKGRNEDPLRMEAVLTDLPPGEDDQYLDALGRPLPIFTEQGIEIGRVVDALHIPNPPPPPPPPPPPGATETPEATPTATPEPSPTAEATPSPTPAEAHPEPAIAIGCDHRIPGQESDVIVKITNLQPGQTVSGTVSGPGVIGDGTFSATADANGTAQAKIPINQIGPYEVTVDGLSGSINVGAVCTPP